MTIDTDFIDIGTVEDVPVRGSRLVKTPDATIAIFKTMEGQIFAIEDKCPHLSGPLSQGIVHGNRVTCPLHNLVIDLANGQADGPGGGPNGKCVKTFPIEIMDGRILLKPFDVPSEKVA
ncbi:nitrite reductase small subunit NirD [Pyruvatibacter sp. HU-CL02332]